MTNSGFSTTTGFAERDAESAPGAIGRITLGVKQTGKRSAGNPPAPFDVAGTGNVAMVEL
jgi:hypothetical protein